jgi:ATP-dependent Clp protease ATP-binding subunit ClpC
MLARAAAIRYDPPPMPAYRFPILVWSHPLGCTACLVEDARDIAAMGKTASDAVAQLKELLQWQVKSQRQIRQPNFEDPKLIWMKAEVRPEYQADERVFSVSQTVLLRFPAVLGKDRAGLAACALPTLGVRFTYDENADLPALAAHYVQLELKGKTPQELSRHLPPMAVELTDVSIQVPKDAGSREAEPNLDPLPQVAEPLGVRGTRSRLSRPWQRDAQVNRLTSVLGGEKINVLILGESGVGKTATLVEAVRKVERGDVDFGPADPSDDEKDTLRVKNRFWLSSAARLIAGMKYLGQWQERVEEVISKLSDIDGVLCVDNLLDLVRTGGESPNNSLAAFLVPYLQRGELRLVGESTNAELDACRRLLPAFASVFTIVEIPEFNPPAAVAALSQLATVAKQNLKVDFTPDAIRQVYRLFSRFMPYQSFPGRAAAFTTDLFDRAAHAKEPSVSSALVIERFIQLTGLPELFLRDDQPLQFDEVLESFSEKVIGQSAACRTAAGVITTFKAGLNDPARPLGVLLFCGPTGVGKTELARTIAEFLFGKGEKRDRLVRLDMSEYSGPGAARRLLGTPGGEPSELIKRLREQPFTVVLLDEIEKADAEVFDLLLGVFDEGRLTDRYGRLTTFRSALIIMTSNLGADRMEPFGLSKSSSSNYDMEAASFFRPEFFNRIDAVVTFDPLSEQTIRGIAIAELGRIAQREGLTANRVKLRWSDEIVTMVCEAGYDARYGARPLQRAIETLVVTPLAKFLVGRGKLKDVTVTVQRGSGGAMEFSVGG